MNDKFHDNKETKNSNEEKTEEINKKNKTILFYSFMIIIYSSTPATYLPLVMPIANYVENNHPEKFNKVVNMFNVKTQEEKDIQDSNISE